MAEKNIKNIQDFVVPTPFTEELLFPKSPDQIQLMGWIYDVHKDVFQCSDDMLRVLGLSKDTSYRLEDFIRWVHPDDQKRMTLHFQAAINEKAPLMTIIRIFIKNQIHWFEMIARNDGHIEKDIQFVGTLQDVTKSIFSMTSSEKNNGEPKRTLLSTISHELRTPMNAIIGFADILDKELVHPEQKKYLKRIQDASQHMLSMINDVLDLSKIDAGKLSIEHIPFSLDQMIETTIKMVEPLAKRKHLFLEIERLNCPNFLIGDVHRIRQILLNLLSNAIKFTETGGISFVIKGEMIPKNHHVMVSFIVRDTGIGMTETQCHRLFKDFEQADVSTQRLYGGTGLGLSISSRLAHLMQGKITVESTLNEGSSFTLILPMEIAETDHNHDEKPIIDQKRFKGTSILVAEDHQLSQILIEHILSKLEVKITLVDNGKKAIDLAKSMPFDWIILDMEMPIMGGIESAETIRRFNEKTPILAMTANHMDEDRARCLLAGMNDVMTKPIDRNHLLSTLLKWLPEIN
ncbi:MAG: response regulator [Acholeplasma sp.]|jgi:signal transduction histidine kinase/ActR/RegA family two-component response regulator|nr:MAG: response regulator [Acholeplasma sp.]